MIASIRIENIVWIFFFQIDDTHWFDWHELAQRLTMPFFTLLLFVVPLRMYLSHKYFALFYLWDAMSVRLHRSFHYDGHNNYCCSYTNDDDARASLANRFQMSNAKSFLFSRSLAMILFSPIIRVRVHSFSSLFMLSFVSIYGLNSSIAPSNNWS